MANVIKHKRGSGSDPVASDLVVGEVAIRTDVGKLFTKMDNGSVAEIAGGGSDIAINTLSSSSATGGGSATFNGSAYRFTLSAPPSVSAQQLLVSINGVIQKPVAGTGQPSEGFSVDGTDIILGDAPATGSDFFILTFKSLGVSEPADNSVTSAKIVDGAIVNADINASAAIAGSKINPVSLADVGIGVSSPNVRLHQHIGTSGTNSHRFTNTTTGTGSTDGFILGLSGDEHVLLWNYENTPFRLATNSTERVRVTESGLVGIGTTSPAAPFHVYNATNNTIARLESGDATARLHLKDNSGEAFVEATGDNLIFSNTSSTTERMRLDSSGRLLIGTTSSKTLDNADCSLQVIGSNFSNSGFTQQRYVNSVSGPSLLFAKSRSGTIGTQTIVQNGDELGKIRFYGSDGNDFDNYAAEIKANVDATPGSNDMPGRLVFLTTSDGAAAPTERMRIGSNGDITVNFDGAGNQTGELLIGDGTESAPVLSFWADGSNDTGIFRPGANTLGFTTTGSERLRIDSSGDVLINRNTSIDVASTATSKLQVHHGSGNISAAFYSTANALGPSGVLALGHARGSDSGVLQDDDVLGQIRFAGGDGNDLVTIGALISAEVNGTPSGNVMPTDLVFSTNSGSGSTGERMRMLKSGGLTFNGDTATANALDDYEEGTFTPVMKFGGANTGMSTGNVEAIYTKIGRMVYATIRFTMSGKGSSTGQLTFEGLPYAVGDVLSSTSVQGGFDIQYLQGNVNAHEIKVYPWESTSLMKAFKRSNQNSTTSNFTDSDISGQFDGRISFFYTTA